MKIYSLFIASAMATMVLLTGCANKDMEEANSGFLKTETELSG